MIIYSRNVFEESREDGNYDDNFAMMDAAVNDEVGTDMNSVEQGSGSVTPRWVWFPRPTGAPSSWRKKCK